MIEAKDSDTSELREPLHMGRRDRFAQAAPRTFVCIRRKLGPSRPRPHHQRHGDQWRRRRGWWRCRRNGYQRRPLQFRGRDRRVGRREPSWGRCARRWGRRQRHGFDVGSGHHNRGGDRVGGKRRNRDRTGDGRCGRKRDCHGECGEHNRSRRCGSCGRIWRKGRNRKRCRGCRRWICGRCRFRLRTVVGRGSDVGVQPGGWWPRWLFGRRRGG